MSKIKFTKVSKGVESLFEPPKEQLSPKPVNVVSTGTLPFPKETASIAKPAKVEQSKVFPTTRNSGEAVTLEQAKTIICGALFQRMREISMIGFATQREYEMSDDKDNVPVEYQVLKEKALKKLINGETRHGHVLMLTGDANEVMARPWTVGYLTQMVKACKSVAPIKRMSNQRKLFMFELGDDHKAFTDTVRLEDMLRNNFQKLIRMEREQILDKDGNVTGYRPLLYTPKGACALPETRLVSFIYHDDSGLEMWQPGQYIGSLNPKEREAWVHLDLLEH